MNITLKATGIVRRIDDLGRIVIPKDIRTRIGVEENSPLEIFGTPDGGIYLRPYRPDEQSEGMDIGTTETAKDDTELVQLTDWEGGTVFANLTKNAREFVDWLGENHIDPSAGYENIKGNDYPKF